MKLIEVNELNSVLIAQLLEVWDKSVRETYLFLSDSEIKNWRYVHRFSELLVIQIHSALPISYKISRGPSVFVNNSNY